MKVARGLLLLLPLSTTVLAGEYVSPTFDCDVADERAERIICSFEDLCILDQELGQALKAVNGKSEAILKAQAEWVSSTRNNCATVDCLRDVYRKRIAALRKPVSVVVSPEKTKEVNSDGQPRARGGVLQRDEVKDTLPPTVMVSNPVPGVGKSDSASTKKEESEEKDVSNDERSLWSTVKWFFRELLSYSFLVGIIFLLWKTLKYIANELGSSSGEGSYRSSPGSTRPRTTSSRTAESSQLDSAGTKVIMRSYSATRKCCATCSYWHGRRETKGSNSMVMAEDRKSLCQVSTMTRDPITKAPRGTSRREMPPNFGLNCKYHRPWL